MRIKKILSFVVAISLMSSLAISAFADNSTKTFNAATRLATAGVKTSSYKWNSGASYYLGDSIPTYILKQGSLTTCSDTKYYPIYQNAKIVGILTEIGSNTGAPSYTLSPSFADKLNSITQSGQRTFKLVLNARQVFVYCNNVATELACYDVELSGSDQDASAATVQKAVNNISTRSYAPSFNSSNKKLIPIATINTRSSDCVASLLNVYEWQQPTGSDRCWAATIWCIGEYMIDPEASKFSDPNKLAEYLKPKHTTITDCIRYLNDVYGVRLTEINSTISVNLVESLIDQDKPFMMCWWHDNSSTALGHMVTGCGYSKGGGVVTEIGVMDSLAGEIIWVSKSSDGTYTEKMGNYTYTWRQTGIQN